MANGNLWPYGNYVSKYAATQSIQTEVCNMNYRVKQTHFLMTKYLRAFPNVWSSSFIINVWHVSSMPFSLCVNICTTTQISFIIFLLITLLLYYFLLYYIALATDGKVLFHSMKNEMALALLVPIYVMTLFIANANITVSHKKTCHFYFCDNFGKCRPILKILSVLHPGRNGGQSLI